MIQQCIKCGKEYNINEIIYFCKNCGEILEVKMDFNKLGAKQYQFEKENAPLSVWRYKEFLPVRDFSKIISLNEGGTSLHSCHRLGKQIGLLQLWVKNEGENPTGSFKDRGMTVGVSKALELGVKSVICASTGNTSASLAAYAAKAGLECAVLIPSGKIAYGKLAQAMIYGAKVLQIRGNFDQALENVLKLSEKYSSIYLLNSINPFRLEGQKTLGFEICEQLDYEVPDRVIVPVGNAGNISAIWKGFTEFQKLGYIKKLPKMTGIQAVGASPIVQAMKTNSEEIERVEEPETVATAIRIGAPVSWRKALNAIRVSGGTAETVTDDEILMAQKLLSRIEGIFVEPASASSIAGLIKLVNNEVITKEEKVVCVTTGHGLKDPDTAIKMSEKPLEVDAKINSIEKTLGLLKDKKIVTKVE